MTYLDAGVLIILLLFLVRGLWIGLVRQLASIAALVFGFIAAGHYYQQFGVLLESFVPSRLSFLITYGLLFLAVYLAVIGVGYGLRKVMSISFLGWFDRLMGGVFGLSKAVILATVLFMAFTGFMAASDPVLQRSYSTPYLTTSSRFFMTFIRDQKLQSQFLPREPAISILRPLAVPEAKTVGGDTQPKAKQDKLIAQGGS